MWGIVTALIVLVCPRLFYWLLRPRGSQPRWFYRLTGSVLTVVLSMALSHEWHQQQQQQPRHQHHHTVTVANTTATVLTSPTPQLFSCASGGDLEYCVSESMMWPSSGDERTETQFYVDAADALYFTGRHDQHTVLWRETALLERLYTLTQQGLHCPCATQLGVRANVSFVMLRGRWSVLYDVGVRRTETQLALVTGRATERELWLEFNAPLTQATESQRLLLRRYNETVQSVTPHVTVLRRVLQRERLPLLLSGEAAVRCFNQCVAVP